MPWSRIVQHSVLLSVLWNVNAVIIRTLVSCARLRRTIRPNKSTDRVVSFSVDVGPQIVMNPKPILALTDLESDSGSPRSYMGIAILVFFQSRTRSAFSHQN